MPDLDTFAQPGDVATYSQGAIAVDDPRLPGALKGVTNAIRRWCGWHIALSRTEDLVLDGPGGRQFELPSKYVTAVNSVTETSTAIDAAGYSWSQLGTLRRSDHQWWTRELRGLTVNLTHGYSEVPDDIQQAVLSILARQLSSPLGVVREQTLSASVTWSLTAPGVAGGIALLSHEQALLEPYRIVDV
jgi:hypothetical protein